MSIDTDFQPGDKVTFRRGIVILPGFVVAVTRDHCIINYTIYAHGDNTVSCQFFAPKKDVWLKGGSYIPTL